MNLEQFKQDGRGQINTLGGGEFAVSVESPFTLWCPEPATGNVRLAFDCQVTAANSAMLLIAQAQNWYGQKSPIELDMEGRYDDYNCGKLEMYTIGFNRTGHVSNEVQPNASTANVRRIGGAGFDRFSGDNMRMGTANANMKLWQEWDDLSLLGSACEFASGTSQYFHYEFFFTRPRIGIHLNGIELFTLVDHRPLPLCGGYWAIRNMTPGGSYKIKSMEVEAL